MRFLDYSQPLPQVIVPAPVADVAAATEFVAQAQALLRSDNEAFAAVEWRADALTDQQDAHAVLHCLQALQVPILATLRTRAEGGGAFTGDDAAYAQRIRELLTLPVAAVDIELRRVGAGDLVRAAANAQVCAVVSYHNWFGTPAPAELATVFAELAQLAREASCADDVGNCANQDVFAAPAVVKLAVTVTSEDDVSVLQRAAADLQLAAGLPVIAIAMGEHGTATRRLRDNPSVATFGVVGAATAPGQLSVQQLSAERAQLLAGS